ncbi:Calcium-dependent protein kinase 3 [Geodia barretti]|uniref:Calcium-dependent protein kinase 3 n=1 Tax=Geodia barretti TaxID=519541 RepID=A0AA35XB92_GEOBA|nr:Calcium-dependent protein kinase 3 [Geodia barretti]
MARSNGANSKRCSLYTDLDHLRTMFASVDPANTGYIGYQELRSLAQSGAGMDEAMVAVVLQKLDRDKDGKISFDDFQALFESERESIKRQRIEKSNASGGNEEHKLVLESSPLAIVASPLDESTKNAGVLLRHKRPLRLQREEQSHSSGLELSFAHIGRGPRDELSPVEHGQYSNQVYTFFYCVTSE